MVLADTLAEKSMAVDSESSGELIENNTVKKSAYSVNQ
jgi:hypothetical protein